MILEKFALLNLIKALDGIKNLQSGQKGAADPPPPPPAAAENTDGNRAAPNIMFETLLRHEQVSNRLKNRRGM